MVFARWIAVLILLPVIGACGTDRPTDQADAPTAVGSTATSASPVSYPGTVRLSATAIRKTRTGVVVDVDLPAGAPGCGGRPRVRVGDAGRHLVRITANVPTSGAPECVTSRPGTLRVDLDLRGRDLEMNTELWERGPGATFVRCGGLGCDPPKDRCDPVYTYAVGARVELPPERHLDVLACDVPWLVVDVDAVITGCQSVDGSTPPAGCEVFRSRWFAHLEEGGWQVVAAGAGGGCAEVLAQVPDFPSRLCAGLPPREPSAP